MRRSIVFFPTTMLAFFLVAPLAGQVPLKLSTDKFTNSDSTHKTEVEPASFAWGSTIVSAFHVARRPGSIGWGSADVGFSTSTNGGKTWKYGVLPGLTINYKNGTYGAAADPSVAYDAKHGQWLISTLPLAGLNPQSGTIGDVAVSRSTDGLTWGNPIAIDTTHLDDKNWTVCDNTTTSPFYGNCYTEWDDNGAGNRMEMSRSTDGGATWSVAATNSNGIIGGQPVVRPDGTVIVPTANANETAIGAFNSTNGGVSWSATTTIATVRHHTVAGSLREGPLPSAEIDSAGTVYVVWADSRFRSGGKVNDIVIIHSLNATGTSWSSVTRIPIDTTGSGIDHFIPGLAVNKATSGATVQLGLTYYFYPKGTTQLSVGFTSSADAGSNWSTPQTMVSGMTSTWAATTSQGRMVGDYISTSYGSDNLAHGIFGSAYTPTSGTSCSSVLDNCNAPIDTFTPGLASGATSGLNDQVLFAGNGNGNGNGDAQNFWNLVNNEGIQHRD